MANFSSKVTRGVAALAVTIFSVDPGHKCFVDAVRVKPHHSPQKMAAAVAWRQLKIREAGGHLPKSSSSRSSSQVKQQQVTGLDARRLFADRADLLFDSLTPAERRMFNDEDTIRITDYIFESHSNFEKIMEQIEKSYRKSHYHSKWDANELTAVESFIGMLKLVHAQIKGDDDALVQQCRGNRDQFDGALLLMPQNIKKKLLTKFLI